MVPGFQWWAALRHQEQCAPGPCCPGFLTIYQFNYLRVKGAKPPTKELFMALYYNLPVFKQDEMGAKKIKGQDFFIEVSAFLNS